MSLRAIKRDEVCKLLPFFKKHVQTKEVRIIRIWLMGDGSNEIGEPREGAWRLVDGHVDVHGPTIT
jgi:hypothetical protein